MIRSIVIISEEVCPDTPLDKPNPNCRVVLALRIVKPNLNTTKTPSDLGNTGNIQWLARLLLHGSTFPSDKSPTTPSTSGVLRTPIGIIMLAPNENLHGFFPL